MRNAISYFSKIVFIIFMLAIIFLTLFTNVNPVLDSSSNFWIVIFTIFFFVELIYSFYYKKKTVLSIMNTLILLEVSIYLILK